MLIFNDYKTIGKNLRPEEMLSLARNKLRQGLSSETRDFTKLENYLQSVFYGLQGDGSITSRLQETAAKFFGETLDRVFENYNFEKDFFSEKQPDGKIGLTEKTSFSHKNYIAYNTVWKRMQEARYQLEQLSSSKDPSKEYETIMQNLQQLISTAYSIEESSPVFLNQAGYKVFKITENNKDLIAQLDRLYKAVSFMASLPLTNNELGSVFERALQVVGSGNPVETMTDDLLYEIFSQASAGSMNVSRGGIIQLSGMDYKVKKPTKKSQKSIRYEVTGQNGSVFTIGGEFDAKQGKMDVKFIMPDSKEQFKISAKNWKTLSGQDFGETDLEGALARTAGIVNTISFGVAVGFAKSKLNDAHKYAKMCVALDILMGYSQENNYADTIVINDRSASRIRVYSIEKILNNLNYELITNYPTNLRDNIRNNFNVKRALGPQGYENKILTELKEYKLSISAKVVI